MTEMIHKPQTYLPWEIVKHEGHMDIQPVGEPSLRVTSILVENYEMWNGISAWSQALEEAEFIVEAANRCQESPCAPTPPK